MFSFSEIYTIWLKDIIAHTQKEGGDSMNSIRHGNALTDKLKQNGASDKTIIVVKQQIPAPWRW